MSPVSAAHTYTVLYTFALQTYSYTLYHFQATNQCLSPLLNSIPLSLYSSILFIMSQTTPWRDDPTSFVTDGVRIGVAAAPPAMPTVPPAVPYGGGVDRNWKFHAVEFWRGFAEMSVEFGKGVRDVMKQSVMRDDSFLVKNFGPPVRKVRKELKFLNEYLPEDRDPVHSWSVIFVVLFFVIAGLNFVYALIWFEFARFCFRSFMCVFICVCVN